MKHSFATLLSLSFAFVLVGCGSSNGVTGPGFGDDGGSPGNNGSDGGSPGTGDDGSVSNNNDGGGPGPGADGGGPTSEGGGTVPDSGPIPTCEAGAPAATDGGTVGMTPAGPGGYPASHLDFAAMVYGGDRLLYHPKVVTVTFPSDAQASTYEAFGDSITSSAWWDGVTAGYCDTCGNCVGHGIGGGHVHLTAAAAATYTDSATPGDPSTLKDLIKAQVASGTFPAPDNDTLYAIYFPTATTITLKNGTQTAQSCQAFGGYHMHVPVTTPGGGTVDVAYAVLPECGFPASLQGPWSVAASHEIIEATTDPLPTATTVNGWYMDQTRDAWQAIGAGEVGDACALLQDFASNPLANPGPWDYTESGTVVQRIWNNKSLLAGHDPCVPEGTGVYFNVAPTVEKLVMKTGDTKTIALTGFSTAATSDWNVAVKDFGALTNPLGTPVLALTLDKSTANNGSTLNLTIKVNGTVDPTNGAPFVIVSTDTAGSHIAYWPGIVEAQ